MAKGNIIIEEIDGQLDVEIVLDPPLSEAQKIGEEDLNDVQIIAGILASVLDGVLRFEDDPEEESAPVDS